MTGVVQLMIRIVQHGRVVVRVPVKIVMVHRSLKVITMEAGHGGSRVFMVLDRRSGDEILEAEIRVPAASSAPGELEAPPAPAAPFHAVEG